MRVVVQRVKEASCYVNNEIVGKIDNGLMLLVSFTHADTIENVKKMAYKISGLRIFDDLNGKMNFNINDVGGSILSISQFTLYGNCNKGFRPSFVDSMDFSKASTLYNSFNDILKNEYHLQVETGVFGAHMYLHPICDGPVTLILEF